MQIQWVQLVYSKVFKVIKLPLHGKRSAKVLLRESLCSMLSK